MSPSPSEVTAHNEGDCWGDRRCPCCAAEADLIGCDGCDFTSPDPEDFADLGGDRMFAGSLVAGPVHCWACSEVRP